jgi:hypothetical protein
MLLLEMSMHILLFSVFSVGLGVSISLRGADHSVFGSQSKVLAQEFTCTSSSVSKVKTVLLLINV